MAKKNFCRDRMMKTWSKINYTLGMVLVSAVLGCNKENVSKNSAILLGADYRMCACCGGRFIEIVHDTLRFDNQPSNSDVDLNTAEFPLKVDVKWKKKETACMSDLIEVTSLKKR